jgi:hypothetical protein
LRTGLYLVGIVLLAWGASIAGPFHFDDYNLFVDPLITSANGWLKVWQPIQTRPLSQFTFWMTYAMAGATPWAFHLWNIVLHAIASLLVSRTLRLLISERAALIAAVLFAVHPIQAESVDYVFARSTELSTVLCLVALWLWLRDRVWAAVAVFGVALLAKEECVTFPIFLALIDWWRGGKRRWGAIAAMLGLSFILGMRVLIATKLVSASGGGFASRVTPIEYLSVQGIVILRYLRLLIVPWGFTVDPEIRVVVPWLAWLAVVALIGAAVYGAIRFRGACVWMLGALILLIPSSSIFPADDFAADHRMYLPMIAFCAAIGLIVERWDPRVLVAGAVVLAGLSVMRTHMWSSERTLWEEAVERAPDKVRPRIQLARSVDAKEGLAVLDAANRRFPNQFNIETERGRLLLATGHPPEALAAFGHALALSPKSALAFNNRGVALAALGQNDAARADFERALRADRCFAEAADNLRRLGFAVPERTEPCGL